MKLKKIVLGIFIYMLVILLPSYVFASPMFELYPQSGVVKDPTKGFTVDVLIDSDNEDITQARFTIKFDPELAQVRSANKNNSLFDQWPDDESSIDNTNGVIVLTGFTQSGVRGLYNGDGTKDVLARIDFDVISKVKKDIVLEFEYGGVDTIFTSEIMKEGSPPVNVLLTKPESGVYAYTGSTVPSTGIEPQHLTIVLGLILISIGVFVTSTKSNPLRKKRGTVVLYD